MARAERTPGCARLHTRILGGGLTLSGLGVKEGKMKRALSLIMALPAVAGLLILSGCGDGREPSKAAPPAVATNTPLPPPSFTRTVPISTPTRTPTATGGATNTPTATGGATNSPTPTGSTGPSCGDGTMQAPEECDDGNN